MRIRTLQSLRFVFIMLIFMSHFSADGVPAFDAGGDCGVAFFFLLSGFSLSLGYGERLRQGTFYYGQFLRRRLIKLYPLHLLCLLVAVLIYRQPLDLRFVANMMLVQSWIPDIDWYYSYNSVAWFLSTLLFCYLLFPVLYRLASKRMVVVVALLTVVLYVVTPYERVQSVLYVHPLTRWIDFYWGMVLCRIYERRKDMPVQGWMEWGSVAALIAALAVYPYADGKLRNAPLYWMVLIPMVLVFVRERGVWSRLLCTRPLCWLGQLAMPVFLTHKLVIGVMQHRLADWPYGVQLAVCLAVTLMVSWLIDCLFLRQISRLRII